MKNNYNQVLVMLLALLESLGVLPSRGMKVARRAFARVGSAEFGKLESLKSLQAGLVRKKENLLEDITRLKEASPRQVFGEKRSFQNLLGIWIPALLIPVLMVVSIYTVSSFVQANSLTGSGWAGFGIAISIWSAVAIKYYVNTAFVSVKWLVDILMALVLLASFGMSLWQTCVHFMVEEAPPAMDAGFGAMAVSWDAPPIVEEPTSLALLFIGLVLLEWSSVYGLTGIFLSAMSPEFNVFGVKIRRELELLERKLLVVDHKLSKVNGKCAQVEKGIDEKLAPAEAVQKAISQIGETIKRGLNDTNKPGGPGAVAGLVLGSLLLGGGNDLSAQDRIIVVSPKLDNKLAGKAFQVGSHLMQTAPEGCRVRLYSGGNLPTEILSFEQEKFANKKIAERAKVAREGRLRAYIGQCVSTNQMAKASGSINLPKVMTALQHHVKRPTQLILVGSPLWDWSSECSFVVHSERDAEKRYRLPSSAFLTCDPNLSSFVVEAGAPRLEVMTAFWWDITAGRESLPDGFAGHVQAFWSAYLGLYGAKLAPVQLDPASTLGLIARKSVPHVEPHYAQLEEERVMVTAGDLKAGAIKRAIPAELSHVFVADASGSMQKYLLRCAAEMSMRKEQVDKHYGLVVYHDYPSDYKGLFKSKPAKEEPAWVQKVSANPRDLAAAFRELKPSAGSTTEEAMNEGLATALHLLRERKAKGSEVIIYSDAPPKVLKDCPPGSPDYKDVIAALLAEGHSVTLVRCGKLKTSWVPKGVTIRDLK